MHSIRKDVGINPPPCIYYPHFLSLTYHFHCSWEKLQSEPGKKARPWWFDNCLHPFLQVFKHLVTGMQTPTHLSIKYMISLQL
jgi:hypothetical protein